MQVYYIVNNEGKVVRKESACFGLLSYLDHYDWGQREFRPGKIDHLVVSPEESNEKSSKGDIDLASQELKKLINGGHFNQYLGHISYDISDEVKGKLEPDNENQFKVSIYGQDIQTSMIGAFMARNVTTYYFKRKVFVELIKNGCDADIAFILANIFSYSTDCMGEGSLYLAEGDADVFGWRANMGDVLSVFKGETWNHYQGAWGDHDCGYCRYGYMDSQEEEPADICARTDRPLALTDTTLKEKDYSGFPSLYLYFEEASGDNSGRIGMNSFIEKVVPKFTDFIREGTKGDKI